MLPAIFLDRDGVIIENRSNYVREWRDVEFIPSAVHALAQYTLHSYRIILVTNQSAVGRDIITLSNAQAINQKIVDELRKNGCRIDGYFVCPHKPEDNCICRKPQPGLLLQAEKLMSIDLSLSFMIGDAWTDLQAGQAASVAKVGLVLTGRGRQQLTLVKPKDILNAYIFKDLSEALSTLLLNR